MSQLTISLPPELQSWVESQLGGGEYVDAGDYFRDLIRRDRANALDDVHTLRAMVEEGIASGIDPREPEDILREVMARIGSG